jgi:hypothetical protein
MNKTFKMMPLDMEAETALQLLGITKERFNELVKDMSKGKEIQRTSEAIERAFEICNNANELAAMMFVIGERCL